MILQWSVIAPIKIALIVGDHESHIYYTQITQIHMHQTFLFSPELLLDLFGVLGASLGDEFFAHTRILLFLLSSPETLSLLLSRPASVISGVQAPDHTKLWMWIKRWGTVKSEQGYSFKYHT